MVRNMLNKNDEMIIQAQHMESTIEEKQARFFEIINNCFLLVGLSCSIIVVLTFLFK